MLPNVFPGAGDHPEYNTVDASLWFFEAVARLSSTRPAIVAALREAFPVSARRSSPGTRRARATASGVDAADGLLQAGEPGVQLTWMDAKVGDWVVTPRIGKPVEINALWYNALCIMAAFAQAIGGAGHVQRPGGNRQAKFRPFPCARDGEGLYDVSTVRWSEWERRQHPA